MLSFGFAFTIHGLFQFNGAIVTNAEKPLRILFAHLVYAPGVQAWYREVALTADSNLHITPFCVTLNPPGPRLSWFELHRLWKAKDKTLLTMYSRLQEAAVDCDVLLLYNGA